jgi:BirA family biotin operon repressor/biotin-[acetyl-CoA-carboxylase] ligase
MFDIHYYETVESTMDIARNNPRHGLVIQGGEQTGGRGRRGNQWLSPKGNLYQSIVLKPETSRQYWGQLSFVIAVALGTACEKCSIEKYVLKWPNDVLIDERKLAGILIEGHDDFVIIGTGVNIEICPDDRAKIHDVTDISVTDFRDLFLAQIEQFFTLWERDGFSSIRELWMKRAYKLGEDIRANLKDRSYKGKFHNIDSDGFLILQSINNEEIRVSSSEIINWEG